MLDHHIKRVFWPIRLSAPNEHEREQLEQQTPKHPTNEALKQFLAWRRSNLLIAAPSVLVSVGLGFYNLKLLWDTGVFSEAGGLNVLGKLVALLPELSDFACILRIILLASNPP